MFKDGEESHFEVDEARGGATPGVMRYVLIGSLLLAILALSTIWISGAVSLLPENGDPVTAEEYALAN